MSKQSQSGCPFAPQPKTPNPYDCLYHAFVQNEEVSCSTTSNANCSITSQLHKQSASKDDNDFIVIGSTEMVLRTKTQAPMKIPFRRGTVSGFTELTAISHITPGMAYLAQQFEDGGEESDSAKVAAQNMKTALTDLKNNASKFDWLDELVDKYQSPVFSSRRTQVENMFNWALTEAIAFLDKYPTFTMADVIKEFGLQNDSSSNKNALKWKVVMVSTFEMVVADLMATLTLPPPASVGGTDYSAILKAVDWSNTEVISAGQIGATSAGLNKTNNSTFKSLQAIAKHYDSNNIGIQDKHVIFAPYAMNTNWQPDSDTPSAEDLYNEFKLVYNNLKDRVNVSEAMFANLRTVAGSDTNIPTIPQALYGVKGMDGSNIDGMYTKRYNENLESAIPLDKTNNDTIIDSLVRRMAFTMIDPIDTLSDCVTARVMELWAEADYDVTKIAIDGLDHFS